MIQKIEIVLYPEDASNRDVINNKVLQKLSINPGELKAVVPVKRSIDARSKKPVIRLLCDVYIDEFPQLKKESFNYIPVKEDKKAIIIGFGPAGMFASLRLIELGIKPIVFERGKDVQTRRRDLRAIQQFHTVNPDSNYCFGEGGAGTYSDGKLYTRSNKRGDVKKILDILIKHGAKESVAIDAHPHIGSNLLPGIVKSIRETILNCGGEIHFNSKLTGLILNDKKLRGVVINESAEYKADAVVLATGHSARDIFYLLHKEGVKLEAKQFAMGVRIEHPQVLIDEIQYHTKKRDEYLPAASYSLTCRVKDRGVFSFCMCPGGIIVPASTAPGELVLNGMSLSRRNSPFANSGFVAEVKEADYYNSELKVNEFYKYGVFAGLEYQKWIEKIAFNAGGEKQTAPAQRVTDFINQKISGSLPATSYIPGIVSAPLHELLPKPISISLQNALIESGKKMRGYITEEAVILAAETRTSSPIRIPREKTTLMHSEIEGLFPSGEGAGYAGGIVSAAIDGENCADAVKNYMETL